ncbi:MAG: hypothetical protein J5637_02490 [Prevotella sp.]|nr:hypothetical protein [Prevotella sp.]
MMNTVISIFKWLNAKKSQCVLLSLFCMLLALSAHAQKNDSIPFLFRGHLIIHSTINDSVRCNILYDTGGADMFIVDSVYLAHSNWKPIKFATAMAGGGAGKTKVKVIIDPTKVDIGTIEDNYKMVPVFKLRDVVDCHIDGLWGIKNVSDYPFEINFEHCFLKQHKQGMPDIEGYMKLPIRFEDNKIMLQAETCIGGTNINGWFLLDTGGGSSIIYTAQTVADYQLETLPGKRHIEDISQFGIGDKKQETLVNMLSDRIVIGTDTICNTPITYIPEGTGAFDDRPYLGVIGNDILSKFNILIDVKNLTLYLRRHKDEKPLEPTYDYCFQNRTDIGKGWIVRSLTRDGDAAGAGMELGDIITAINGKNVSEYSWEEEYDIDTIPRQTIDIIGAGGKTKHIILDAKKQW